MKIKNTMSQNVTSLKRQINLYKERLSTILEVKTVNKKSCACGKFYFSIDNFGKIMGGIKNKYPDSFNETIHRANRAKNHVFNIFGTEIHFNGDIDWFFEPLGGKTWPNEYTKWIDCRGTNRIGDVLSTWTLNVHHHFFDLGKAYLYTHEEMYAEAICHQAKFWRRQNPYMMGINWESSLTISLRCISWIFAFFFIQKSRIFQRKGRDCLLMGILEGAKHVSRNMSKKGYNHLIGEACFITMVGILFPFFKEAHEWKNTGLRILISESERQFYDDGGHKEQSLSYHKFVVDLYLLGFILAIKNGMKVPELLSRKIEKALEFLMYTVKPDGTWPDIGDNSEIQAHFLTGRNALHDARSPLAIGSVLFNRPDFKHIAGDDTESLLWLLGSEFLDVYRNLSHSENANRSSMILEKSGYFIMRAEKDNKYCIFDFGKQGIGLSAHGHADLFGFELFAGNTSFIVDSGTFTYNGDRKWRDYFRSTAAHNSVTISNESQAVMTGTFSWAKIPSVTIHNISTNEEYDLIEASHDGYKRLSNPVIHTRRIIFKKPDFWIIEDLVAGTGHHSVEQRFRTLQECHIYSNESLIVRTSRDQGLNLAFVPLDTFELSLKIDRCWISRSYNSKEDIPHICFTKNHALPVRLMMGIFAYKNEDEFKENLKKVYAFDAD